MMTGRLVYPFLFMWAMLNDGNVETMPRAIKNTLSIMYKRAHMMWKRFNQDLRELGTYPTLSTD